VNTHRAFALGNFQVARNRAMQDAQVPAPIAGPGSGANRVAAPAASVEALRSAAIARMPAANNGVPART
jgi:hypothetical protein